MYIINKQTIAIIAVPKPEELYINNLGETTNITNLQHAWANISNPKAYFEQQTLPDCDSIYFKVENNELVEMNAAEKQAVDKKILDNAKFEELNWAHRDRRIRITIPSILTYTDPQYHAWASMCMFLQVPFNVNLAEKSQDDITHAYMKLVYESEGFFVENEILKHSDPRLVIETVGTIIVHEGIINVI